MKQPTSKLWKVKIGDINLHNHTTDLFIYAPDSMEAMRIAKNCLQLGETTLGVSPVSYLPFVFGR